MAGEYSSCIVCGGRKLRPLVRYQSAYLVRCGDCELIFSSRRPSDAELAEHYRSYGTAWFDSEITRRRYRELLDGFEPFRKTNRILDMGCGAGYFLEEASKRGWEAYGSEFGELPLELSRGRGFTVVPAPLTEDSFPADQFDVITSFEVVEHLRDPIDEARVLSRLLREHGLFYCTTPNFDALTRRLLGSRWQVIEYPEHLIYFTAATLTRWLAGSGFICLELATTGLSPATVLDQLKARAPVGDHLSEAGAAPSVGETGNRGGMDERFRGLVERNKLLERSKDVVNSSLTRLRAGDTLKGHFVLDGSR